MTDQNGSLLHKPLGQKGAAPKSLAMPSWVGKAALSAVSLVFVGLGISLIVFNDPMSGEPTASAVIKPREPAAQQAAQPRSAPIDPTTGRAISTAAEMENASGVTVVRPGADAPNSVIIRTRANDCDA
ncbi:MAG: hypothetical protein ACRCWO_00505 [Bosea sp. (in: a-proteobacteria)]